MTDICAPGWQQNIFQSVSRTRSEFKGPESSDVPTRFKNEDAEGRTDFLRWANLPQITYAASPNSLYNMQALRKKLADNPCFVKETVAAEATAGVSYPTSFFVGLVLGGGALIFSLTRSR